MPHVYMIICFTAVVPNVTPSKPVVNKASTITVWSKNGVWYTDKTLKHKANGIIKHMGSCWLFKDGKLVKNAWTKQWGYYYWSDKNGKIIQGTGTLERMGLIIFVVHHPIMLNNLLNN